MNINKAIDHAITKLNEISVVVISADELESKLLAVADRLEGQILVMGLKRLGDTGVDIAEALTRCGIPTQRTSVSRWLSGKQTPDLQRLIALRKIYYVRLKNGKSPVTS